MLGRAICPLLIAAVVMAACGAWAHGGSPEPEEVRALVKQDPNQWAYPRYTAGLGAGRAAVECASPVEAGAVVPEVTVRFVAGAGGIAPGGHVAVWFPVGSTPPQTERADQPGYLTVTHAGQPITPRLEFVYFSRTNPRFAQPTQRLFAYADLPDGLAEGEEVVYRWQQAKVTSQARQWGADRWLFRVYVDHDADGWEEEIAGSPWVPVATGPVRGLILRTESTAVVGEPVRLVVATVDAFRNPAKGYRGAVTFACATGGAALPERCRFTEQDAGSRTFECTFSEPGIHWVTVEDAENGLRAESNPIEVHATAPEYRLYWGDLHVHTEMSADAMNWAQSPPTYRGAYFIGRYRSGLDFMAVTDHHGLAGGSYTQADWERMKRITNDLNDPGEFVALVAAEQSHGLGDQNIYWRGDDAPFLPAVENHPEDLWDFIRSEECMAIPHHVAQSMRPWRWEHFAEDLMPVVEIYSNHGRAEFFGNEPHYSHHPQATLEGHTWRDQLDAGRKLGCIACSDDHTGIPGMVGLTAVWAKELTREAIYDRIRQRRAYGTTNARCILRFSVNNAEMGSEIETNEPPVLRISAACPTEIEDITIVRNGEDVHVAAPEGRVAELEWRDDGFSADAYYYVRVRIQGVPAHEVMIGNGDQFAWSSPVWVRHAGR